MAGITIQNVSANLLTASISRWVDGDPSRFPIQAGESSNWPTRTDSRGFIVYLEQDGGLPYYAPAGATVKFFSMTKVTVNGNIATPLSDATAVAEVLAK
ncbi:hypothetical protein [Burkholderia ubonensis]|uniref:Uncharacterized protein n=1 Tax=Burkholderia ubonensis TaxID=101571 RepID=A0AB74D3I0_9BURK|nr:hypothetical protein [Burkholderia ubonensis]PAJ81643.1 hypothetical protein CJO71_06935 [Burkholderia ubonensis]PAJ99253.1 hypothetical protein CJO68_21695 [Burkholderia ubonensis]RQP75168.1 hypothetical protein DF015_21345 [Burkholderia ubonensis]RQP92327.1 hypothetical protein DF012_20820 [Burkholderia ubonensis]